MSEQRILDDSIRSGSGRVREAGKGRGGGVISPARLAANRRNAQKSTGPKTAVGKARSSQNARKHGFSVPGHIEIESRAAVCALAAGIAGKDASAARRGHATLIARLDHTVVRVRKARIEVMVAGGAFAEVIERLRVLDIYECRAMGQRDLAIREFDRTLPQQTNPTAHPGRPGAAPGIPTNEANDAHELELAPRLPTNEPTDAAAQGLPTNEAKDAITREIPPNKAKETNSSRRRGGFQIRPGCGRTHPGTSHRRSFECGTIRNSKCTGSGYRSRSSIIALPRTRNSKGGLCRYSGLRGPPDSGSIQPDTFYHDAGSNSSSCPTFWLVPAIHLFD